MPRLCGDVPVAYAMAKIDASGRFAEQGLLRTLGWSRGEALTITAEPGTVIIRRDPRGVFTLPCPARCRFRRRCGLGMGCGRATGFCWPRSRAGRLC
ncbi:hypothetical protein [Amycolatopsis sp. YIM 10]|uniref:hypothetical protein n=1 Tax=Amycolatopsis sp. YIM 10 TaxID=2653857 RepID=UPI001290027B|nr:hypothetical protein [Amycolatopsis sp. YIM 10]